MCVAMCCMCHMPTLSHLSQIPRIFPKANMASFPCFQASNTAICINLEVWPVHIWDSTWRSLWCTRHFRQGWHKKYHASSRSNDRMQTPGYQMQILPSLHYMASPCQEYWWIETNTTSNTFWYISLLKCWNSFLFAFEFSLSLELVGYSIWWEVS